MSHSRQRQQIPGPPLTSTFTALSILAGTLTMLRDLRLDDRALTEGLLKSEDEPDFEYALLGPAKMLITGRFEGGDMDDRGDDIVASGGLEQEALIYKVDTPGFKPKKGDLVGAMPDAGVLIGIEIVGNTGTVASPSTRTQPSLSSRRATNCTTCSHGRHRY